MIKFSILLIFIFSSCNALFHQSIQQVTYADGFSFLHIPKTAGRFLITELGHFYKEDLFAKMVNFDARVTKITDTENDFIFCGHEHLVKVVTHNPRKRPIISFVRNHLDRAISHLRYCKSQPDRFKNFNIDLNNLEAVKPLLSSLHYLPYFSPEGAQLDMSRMTEDKLESCVQYTLTNCSFIGDFDHLSDSLHRLNLSLGLSLDVEAIVHTKVNETPNLVEKITNPDVLKFLEENLVWEKLFNERILAGQRWTYGTPVLKQPGDRREALVQYVMPQGFDPDQYITDTELGIDGARNIWKRREAAMLNVIAEATTLK